MSVPKYGRITPIQGDMLGLAGEILHLPDFKASDGQRISEMKESLDSLRETTDCDFGFDLARWDEYLQKSEHRKEYMFPYAWKAVRPKIQELIKDPTRLRLVHMIDADKKSQS